MTRAGNRRVGRHMVRPRPDRAPKHLSWHRDL